MENTDCNNCDFRLTYVSPRNHSEGAKRRIFSNSNLYWPVGLETFKCHVVVLVRVCRFLVSQLCWDLFLALCD